MDTRTAASSYPFDLGAWTRPVSGSTDAQRWFDLGLNWLFGYNHEEAVECFRRALRHDGDCAMAWWGIAYATGPFYNRAWIRFSDAEIAVALPVCFAAARRAQALAHRCAPADRALVEAISRRYQDANTTDRAVLDRWHREFTAAMRDVHAAHPDDPDITALFAEAALTCTPRQLWNLHTGAPAPNALTEEAVAVLERGLCTVARAGRSHPGLLHMLVHALEMSPFPERARGAAARLRGLAPDAGHLEHMPGHVYALCGDYERAVEQSRRAVAADDRYVAYAGVRNFYSTSRCHNFHLYMYAAMFLGQYREALYAADRIRTEATRDLIESSTPFMRAILDGYSAMRTHVLVRFGQWRELTAEPAPPHPDDTPIRFAMHAYGKGVGHANLGEFDAARRARRTFETAMGRFSDEDVFLSNPVADVLAVGQAMLDGELAYHEGDHETAFSRLRAAVARDDRLNYTEPWAWMHPPRHALGALLTEQGRYAEAEAVYRADLGETEDAAERVPRCCQHPDNVWSLHGLHECFLRTGRAREAERISQRLEAVLGRADVPITSSCCCRKA